MTPSTACASLIERFEQCRLEAYLPTPHDVPTIGWGSTGPDIKLGLTWTQDQANARFARSLSIFGHAVDDAVKGPTTQAQFDAIVCLTYNIGVGNLLTSTLLRLHNAGDYEGAAGQFAVWNKQAGKVLRGLVRRRAAEAALYRS